MSNERIPTSATREPEHEFLEQEKRPFQETVSPLSYSVSLDHRPEA